MTKHDADYVCWFPDVDNDEVAAVGGKNASLGEMIQRLKAEDIRIPGGFATTTDAFWAFLETNDLHDGTELASVGESIRSAFLQGSMPGEVDQAIRDAYAEMSRMYDTEATEVAARSSATAEDMPEASFAGQHDSFLNVRGADTVVEAVIGCFASLFTDRAIAYREEHDFDHLSVALSAGIQKTVRSDLAGAGVAFTIDTETGFPDVVSIDAAWRIGEIVVGDRERRPILAKELGAKDVKVVYSDDGDSTRKVDTSEKEQESFVLDDDSRNDTYVHGAGFSSVQATVERAGVDHHEDVSRTPRRADVQRRRGASRLFARDEVVTFAANL